MILARMLTSGLPALDPTPLIVAKRVEMSSRLDRKREFGPPLRTSVEVVVNGMCTDNFSACTDCKEQLEPHEPGRRFSPSSFNLYNWQDVGSRRRRVPLCGETSHFVVQRRAPTCTTEETPRCLRARRMSLKSRLLALAKTSGRN